jgi:hypothetical protein
MPRQVIARILLVCAMLLAQQTALAHDFWHATQAQKAAKGAKLCDLHDLLGTVLGAVSAAAPVSDVLSFSDVAFIAAAYPLAGRRAFFSHSRDPPALS